MTNDTKKTPAAPLKPLSIEALKQVTGGLSSDGATGARKWQ